MAFQISKAQRQKTKLRIALTGASGSGKTMSALRLAYGLTNDWKKICVIDTEQGSASLYSHLGEFNTIPFEAPFEPKRYIEALKVAEKDHDIVIIDSASHEWDGPGGCLEIHTRSGGKFQDWKAVSPLHRSFVAAILQSKAHVITTLRTKSDYQMDKDEGTGKTRVTKVGLKATQREGFDYEVSIEFRINDAHLAIASKDRTGIFGDEIPFQITEATGQKLRDWNDSGIVYVPPPWKKLGYADEIEHKKSYTKIYITAKKANWPDEAVKDFLLKNGFKSSKDIPWNQVGEIYKFIAANPIKKPAPSADDDISEADIAAAEAVDREMGTEVQSEA